MGYITLHTHKNEETKEYVLFHADYLNEAWLAQVNEDETIKIIRQFKCKKFESCFYEAGKLISGLGTVTKMTSNEIDEHYPALLQSTIGNNPLTIHPYPNLAAFNVAFTSKNIWNWLANTLPELRIAN